MIGAVAVVLGGLFAAKATRAAAVVTAEAQRAAARAAAGPNERAEDRAAFDAIKTELRADLESTREEVRSLRSLVRAFAWYVADMTGQMREHGIAPPAPPGRVDEYNRTGV
ncbi:hypothetical protein ACW4TU_30140 [Streptomyces sp. QTS52]